MNKQIILATNNQEKLIEFNQFLKGQPLQIIPQNKLNIAEIDETGLTFVENAILKARHASYYGNLPAIADDSGLVVDALNGAPGVYSARYAAEKNTLKKSSSANNITKLLYELRDIPASKRSARFYCAIVYLRYAKDAIPLIFNGIWEGSIIFSPYGKNGFGYDPIFWVPTHNCTAAELSLEIKNQISHRAQALHHLIDYFNVIT